MCYVSKSFSCFGGKNSLAESGEVLKVHKMLMTLVTKDHLCLCYGYLPSCIAVALRLNVDIYKY